MGVADTLVIFMDLLLPEPRDDRCRAPHFRPISFLVGDRLPVFVDLVRLISRLIAACELPQGGALPTSGASAKA
jgi:hypothetical protein